MPAIGNDWDLFLQEEFQKDYYKTLRAFLKEEYAGHTVYPDMHKIFSALKTTSYKDTKVVILGQDPYHEPNQAHGLCFSVLPGCPPPPSLKNMFKELHEDVGFTIPENGCLTPWAEQGVLLLNTVLTVRAGQANSHKGRGWEIFTDSVISALNKREDPVIFLLWGKNALAKRELIDENRHFILTAAHPSPLSAHNGFFGCRHFSKTNELLIKLIKTPINWQL
ncbi:MAG: uracil-DNA glycosylase [Clostridia bacterium]|nr:uracil-DNA glycosylase [Clostridia bacterium]